MGSAGRRLQLHLTEAKAMLLSDATHAERILSFEVVGPTSK